MVQMGLSSGTEKQPKHKVFGRDIPGTSGTQTTGYPAQKLYASWPFSVVLDREWPGEKNRKMRIKYPPTPPPQKRK